MKIFTAVIALILLFLTVAVQPLVAVALNPGWVEFNTGGRGTLDATHDAWITVAGPDGAQDLRSDAWMQMPPGQYMISFGAKFGVNHTVFWNDMYPGSPPMAFKGWRTSGALSVTCVTCITTTLNVYGSNGVVGLVAAVLASVTPVGVWNSLYLDFGHVPVGGVILISSNGAYGDQSWAYLFPGNYTIMAFAPMGYKFHGWRCGGSVTVVGNTARALLIVADGWPMPGGLEARYEPA
jgi:hypothetical protein